MKRIPLSEIDDEQEFWLGSRFRIYGIGLNVPDPADDFYEYMLAQVPGNSESMLAVNVRGAKAGFALAYVKTAPIKGRFVVNGAALKYSFGTDNTFWLAEE